MYMYIHAIFIITLPFCLNGLFSWLIRIGARPRNTTPDSSNRRLEHESYVDVHSSDSKVLMDYDVNSPVMRAEEELYKLRDMMRNVVASPVQPAQQPKIQRKKFYGGDTLKKSLAVQPRSPGRSPESSRVQKKTQSGSPSSKVSSSKSQKTVRQSDASSSVLNMSKSKGNVSKKSANVPVQNSYNSRRNLDEKPDNKDTDTRLPQGNNVSEPNGVAWVPVHTVTDHRGNSANGGENRKKKGMFDGLKLI